MSKITFSLTGDAFMTRPLGEVPYDGFEAVRGIIEKCDVRFNNLEFTSHDQEGSPAAVSGGTWAMSEPAILDDLKRFSFNIYNTANNHSLDYGEGGVLGTLKHTAERGMATCGTGATLCEANAPAWVEVGGKKVAVIGACSSMKIFHPAGDATTRLRGRPGLNPLGFNTVFHVTQDEYDMLERIAAETDMNAAQNHSIEIGYSMPLPEGKLNFGGQSFLLDERSYKETTPKAADVKRILASVQEAKKTADYVCVSLHAHEYAGTDTAVPAQFVVDFAHQVIDGGADAFIGHGPHVLRGIEIYKGKPIFYSLGNFVFQTETVRLQPADAYIKVGLPTESDVRELMLKRSANDTRGYPTIHEIWHSVIANFTMEDGKLTEIRLYPIELSMGKPMEVRGWPRLDRSMDTVKYLASLSEPYGTKIELEDGCGVIRF